MKRFFLFVTTVLWVTLSAFARDQNVIAVYQMDGQKALRTTINGTTDEPV